MHVAVNRNLPHLYLAGHADAQPYTTKKRGRSSPDPFRDREAHANALLRSLNEALDNARQQTAAHANAGVDSPGFYLEFRLPREAEDFTDKLEDRRRRIELVAVKSVDDAISATVWVPSAASEHFAKKLVAYRDQLTRSEKPKNQALVSRIDAIALAPVQAIFTDAAPFPLQNAPIWWEVWIRSGYLEEFRTTAHRSEIRVAEQVLHFPERDVVLVLATPTALAGLMVNSSAVAEIRLASDTPANFVNMTNAEQREWAQDLTTRLQLPPNGSPAVCILDSGIASDHPLIAPAISAVDIHRYDPAWPLGDSDYWRGHGTRMAGLVLYGDLHGPLIANTPVQLSHRLESVAILHPGGAQHEPKLYGTITQEAVARAEVQAPERKRVVCMAVTSSIDTLRGRPSSWSAALDNLAYGNGEHQQLIVVSAGNVRENIRRQDYLARNDNEPIENPAQSWNALTVGGYTDKVNIASAGLAGWNPVAAAGNLSPTSRTSVSWDREWPIKPDVVFEAGNMVSDGQTCSWTDDLSLLSTFHRPNEKHFEVFSETSAATALASNLTAQILAARPTFWPETVRGLVVHSAEWTPVMRVQFDGARRKIDRVPLLRRYGYGVPSLQRALFSALNDMTLIVEEHIQPFWKDAEHENRVKTRQMRLHRLPWPRAELLALAETTVELRLTLSYFIESNPGERGWTRRHRYASHGLRFAMKGSTESLAAFEARINKAVQVEDALDGIGDASEEWYLGQIRDTGSIHSDYWRGTAADLATRDAVAVFPVSGWWKEKPALERYNRDVRYSLIVTIKAATAVTDIYTPVQNAIQVLVEV